MSSSKIQRYSVGEYKLIVNGTDGVGNIVFDTGSTSGQPSTKGSVIIDGNLTVIGDTTTITSTDLVITDNTIKLGKQIVGPGEQQSVGMTLGQGGVIVDRGNENNVGLFFHEQLQSRDGANNVNGAFILGKIQPDSEVLPSDNAGVLDTKTVGLYLNSIDTTKGNDLNFLRYSVVDAFNQLPRLSVFGTIDYEEGIFPYAGSIGNRTIAISTDESDRISRGGRYDDDLIPNIRAVTDYVRAHYERNFQSQLISPGPDGFVTPGNFATGFSIIDLSSTDAGDPVSKVDIRINDLVNPVATYFQSEIRLFDVKVNNNTLSTAIIDGDLILSGNGIGSVKVISPLNLQKIADPSQPANGTTVYAKDEADGGTGIFFINEVGTQDELISRNKALLFSIIF